MITNPEYLPKERLKQELKKRGIKFNSNENKDYYVQLYRDEVMQGKEPERIISEFSSDEEFVKQNPRVSKKQIKSKGKQAAAPKMDTYLPQVATLSDEELATQLQSYGESIGPITATTRIVYERQLAKLMATEGENAQPVPAVNSHEEVDYEAQNESFIGEWSDDEGEEDEEAESAPPPQKQVYSRPSRTRKQYSETIHISSRGLGDSNLRQRSSKLTSSSSYKPVKPARPTSSAKQPPSPSSSTLWSNVLSLICSILLIILMFSIAFLVYEHYTCPEEQESMIVSGWKKGGLLIEQVKELILKKPPAEDDGAKVTKAESKKPSGKPKKSKPKKPPTSSKKP